MRAYIAHAMTGRSGIELWNEASLAHEQLACFGIRAVDPVVAEGVPLTNEPLASGLDDLKGHWQRDKRLIRSSHVLIDLTPHMKSEGVAHEIGYARYHLWMPVIRVAGRHPTAYSVAAFEDDLIVADLYEAGTKILALFGTWPKRFRWRVRVYGKYWARGFWHKLMRWWK